MDTGVTKCKCSFVMYNPKFSTFFKNITGISRDEVFQNLSSKMSKGDVDQALEFLSNEGHVYSTTDEDHFKTTDS